MSKRALLAMALERTGVLSAILRARTQGWFPWRWLTVLTYHRVAHPGSGYDAAVVDATPEQFDRQISLIKRHFTLIGTRQLAEHLAGGPLPPNPAIITFDDGYLDNHDVALPILRRHGATAVFFVSTGHITDRRLFWWERVNLLTTKSKAGRLRLSYPREMEYAIGSHTERRTAAAALLRVIKDHHALDLDRFLDDLTVASGVAWGKDEELRLTDHLLMTWDHVRALVAAGMEVQSHTRTHRVLQTLPLSDLAVDLRGSKTDLEAQLDQPVRALAYPTGRTVPPEIRQVVKDAGFTLAFTCSTGATDLSSAFDPLQLSRMSVEPDCPDTYFQGMLAIPRLAT